MAEPPVKEHGPDVEPQIGDCTSCGQPLSFVGTNPQSLKCTNPVCFAAFCEDLLVAAYTVAGIPRAPEVFTFGPGSATNVPHRIVRHSPTGLSWGYGGSGPADTALNVLALVAGRDVAERNYQQFKFDVISKIPWGSDTVAELPRTDVELWLLEHGEEPACDR